MGYCNFNDVLKYHKKIILVKEIRENSICFTDDLKNSGLCFVPYSMVSDMRKSATKGVGLFLLLE